METPSRPWPPHKVLGVMKSSLTVPLLLLYTVIATSFSMFAWIVGKIFVKLYKKIFVVLMKKYLCVVKVTTFSRFFSVSLSWLSLVFPMATMKSKKASRPASLPGLLSWTLSTWYPSVPPPGTSTL